MLKGRFQTKLQYILTKLGADEHHLEEIFQEFYAYELQYIQDCMIPLYGNWFQANVQRRSYPVLEGRLFQMFKENNDFFKLCQGYIFMLKDCHHLFAPGAPFLHFVEEAMNRFLHFNPSHGSGKGGMGYGSGWGNRRGTQSAYNENKAMSSSNNENHYLYQNKRPFQQASEAMQIPNQAVWNQGGSKKQKNGQYYQEPTWQSGWESRYPH